MDRRGKVQLAENSMKLFPIQVQSMASILLSFARHPPFIAFLALGALLAACAGPGSEQPGASAPSEVRKPGAASESPVRTMRLPDQGRMTVHAFEYPWSALGRLNIAGRSFCTAAMIGPRHVLVRAVCLFDRGNRRWFAPVDLRFTAGYQRGEWKAAVRIERYVLPSHIANAKSISLAQFSRDWALVKLDQAVGNTTGWLGLIWNDARFVERDLSGDIDIFHFGYSQKLPHVQTLNFTCQKVGLHCPGGGYAIGLIPIVTDGHQFKILPTLARITGPVDRKSKEMLFADMLRAGLQPTVAMTARQSRAESPKRTVILLLRHFDYLPRDDKAVSAAQLRQAIVALERERGWPQRGIASVDLLSRMLTAMQRAVQLVG